MYPYIFETFSPTGYTNLQFLTSSLLLVYRCCGIHTADYSSACLYEAAGSAAVATAAADCTARLTTTPSYTGRQLKE